LDTSNDWYSDMGRGESVREIKFRAWENDKMYYQVRCGGMFNGIPTAPTVWNDEKGDWLNLTGQPYTKVMQYTGLKDKNGKEGYHKDIWAFLNVLYTVEWDDVRAFFYLKHLSKRATIDDHIEMEYFGDGYIVGNMYEGLKEKAE
jgi:hypothetical protein